MSQSHFKTQRDLEDFQLKGIRQTLEYCAANVPYYRELFEKHRVSTDSFNSLHDLRAFPFLEKSILGDHYPFGLHAVPQEKMVRVHSSSGSFGNPAIVGYTENDISLWSDLMIRCLKGSGVKKGDTVHIAYGYGLFTGGLGCHLGAEKMGCTVIPISGGGTKRQVQIIRDLNPKVIMCTPSYLMTIGDEMEALGIDPSKTSLKIGILGAEPWSQELRNQIEKRFKISALDIYGLSEAIGPGVACEDIDNREGAIIWEDIFYPEIIDPNTQKLLPDGEVGELVLTSIGKEAFPIVRYRTGDLTRLIPSQKGVMRKIDRILGRVDDLMIIRGMKFYPTQFEKIICSSELLTPHYYIFLDKKNHLDSVEIHVEMISNFESSLDDVKRIVESSLKKKIKDTLGIAVEIVANPPNTLDRIESGKAKRLIDKRKT